MSGEAAIWSSFRQARTQVCSVVQDDQVQSEGVANRNTVGVHQPAALAVGRAYGHGL
jgi:hypothetical protein